MAVYLIKNWYLLKNCKNIKQSNEQKGEEDYFHKRISALEALVENKLKYTCLSFK